MRRQKDILDEAVNALKDAPVTAGPPQETIDTVLQKLTTADKEPHKLSIKKRIRITERIRAMKRFTKIAAAAVIVMAVVLSITFLDKSISSASAAQVLADAVEAMANLRSVYIKAQMRTLPRDNFELIGLDYDFVSNEMWKEFDGTPQGKWRVEKPGRVVVMDGESSLLLIRPNYAAKGGVGTGFVLWLKDLLDVDKIIDSQLQLAKKLGWNLELTHEIDEDGYEKLVVTVEAKAQGDFTNDWCKNSSIVESDNRRIYRFDADTKLLEDLQVFVYPDDGNEVLVFEITEINYNIDIDPALFTMELPSDVIWFEQPKELADNEKYQEMGPKETALAFFQACAEEDWDEFLKFWSATAVDQRLKDYLGGLEIISIGEPFKSGRYPGWFVPYEIRFRNGRVKRMNLAVRNDNPAKRYVVDGGL